MGLLDNLVAGDDPFGVFKGGGLLDPLPRRTGLRGLLDDPLFQIGAGILAANGPGVGFGQALGRGVLQGLDMADRSDTRRLRGLYTRGQLRRMSDEHERHEREKAARDAYAQRYGGSISGAAPSNIPPPGALPGMGAGEPVPSAGAAPAISGNTSLAGNSAGGGYVPGAAPGRLMSRRDMIDRANFFIANGLPGGDELLRQALNAPAGYYATPNGLGYEPGGPHDPTMIGREAAAREAGTRAISGPTTRTVNRGGSVVTEEFAPGRGWQTVGEGPRYDPNSFHSIVAPILQKVRDKGADSLTPSEREAFDMYARTSPLDQIMRGTSFGGVPGNLGAAQPPAPSATEPGIVGRTWNYLFGAPSSQTAASAAGGQGGNGRAAENPYRSEEEALMDARAALSKGADRLRVQQRLKKFGYDPSKL